MIPNITRAMIIFSLLIMSGLFSCAPTPPEVREPDEPELSSEEQEIMSQKAFTDILDMTANVDKFTILPQMEEKYLELIRNYPNSYFAEESYLRLVQLNLMYYKVPREQKAEDYFREYFEKYPSPKLTNALNDMMLRYYYRFERWEKLAGFVEPEIERYTKTGELEGPLFLFLYSEAMFNLNFLDEAEKGYLTVIRKFPNSQEAKIASKKMEKLKAQRAKEEN